MLVGVPCFFGMGDSYSAGFAANEEQLKVVLLFNFAKFVEWPAERFAEANAPLNLCIFNDADYLNSAGQLAGKQVSQGHPIAVISINDSLQAAQCHMLFVSRAAMAQSGDLLQQLEASQAILTVGESEGFITQGGIINLIKIDDNLRFEISVSTAQRRSLRISSKLLRLAKETY